jgi:hypothetical protein
MRVDAISDALNAYVNASKFRIVMSDEGKPYRVPGFYPIKLFLKGTLNIGSRLILLWLRK